MAVNLSPIGNDAPFVDASGNPLSGGLLYTYTAGSSTAQSTYTTSAGSVANANPIVLDSNGYPSSGGNVVEIWLTAGVSYKFVLETSASVVVWTRDNISGINDTTVTIDQWVAGPAPTYISATSFSLVGDQTTDFNVGRRIKTTNSGGTIYSTIVTSSYTTLTTITVANDSGTLDAGLSAVSYGLLSATNPSIDADIVDRKGTAVASAATCNIWGIAGNYVHVTGSTGPITSFGTAPYAGAKRKVVFDSTPTITYNATTLQTPGAQSIVAQAGDSCVVVADTTVNMIITEYTRAGQPATTRGVIASGRNIAGRTNSSTPNTKIDITADELQLENTDGNTFVAKTVSVTINFGTTGANGLDTGVQASSTWYYGWIIAKPDGTVAGLGSLSATAPSLPSGYTFKALVSAAYSDGSTHFVKYRQTGMWVWYEAYQTALNGGSATTETAIDTSTIVPSIAQLVEFDLSVGGTTDASGNLHFQTHIRIVSGTDFFGREFNIKTATGGAAAQQMPSLMGVVPNVGQNLYYLTSITLGSAPTVYVDIQGFKLPGGGE